MKKNLIITVVLGIISIILGAFATHALKEKLTPDALKSFETAVRYQMYHVLILLFVNSFKGFSVKSKNAISLVFFVGILLFSGSIYAIYLLGISSKSIWFITPLGGLALISGWTLMLMKFIRLNQKE